MSAVPDEILLPLKDRLADWVDPDVAMFFLGKALGAIAPETPWGQAKGLFWGAHPVGMALVDTLRYLADRGILEQRDDYGQYRWARTAPRPGS
jgi:hypothetical protein